MLSLEDLASTALAKLRDQMVKAIEEERTEAIVLGCAGMADLAAALRREFGVPAIDGVGAAVKQAEALVTLGLTTSKRGAYAFPAQKTYTGGLAAFAPSKAIA